MLDPHRELRDYLCPGNIDWVEASLGGRAESCESHHLLSVGIALLVLLLPWKSPLLLQQIQYISKAQRLTSTCKRITSPCDGLRLNLSCWWFDAKASGNFCLHSPSATIFTSSYLHASLPPSIRSSLHRREQEGRSLSIVCGIDSHRQHFNAKHLSKVHLFSQALTITRHTLVTLPSHSLSPLSAFTSHTEQHPTQSEVFQRYVLLAALPNVLSHEVSWTEVGAKRESQSGKVSAPVPP